MYGALSVLLAGVALLGCASRVNTFGFAEDEPEDRAIERAYAPYREPGTAVVEGRVLARGTDGSTIPAAWSVVRITPATKWARAYARRAQESGDLGDGVLSEDRAVVWMTRTDEAGRFRFTSLPAGEYLVLCLARWRAASGDREQTLVSRQFSVAEGEVRVVPMSPG